MSQITPLALMDLAHEQARFYMTQQLTAIREALIGSDELIHMVNRGFGPEQLQAAMCSGDVPVDALILLRQYVVAIAVGAAISIHRGEMFSAPVIPGDTVAELKSSKPNWEPFFAFVERERADGCLLGDRLWRDCFSREGRSCRERLQLRLDELNERFISDVVVGACLNTNDDCLRFAEQYDVDAALAAVKPLDMTVCTASSLQTRTLLERLHDRGAAFMRIVGRMGREAGDRIFEAIAVSPDVPLDLQYKLAAQRYIMVSHVPHVSVAALCKAAGMLMLLKDYEQARTWATNALDAIRRRGYDSPTIVSKRAAIVTALQRGQLTPTPAPLLPRRTAAQKKADANFAFRSHLYLARSLTGLIRQGIQSGTVLGEVPQQEHLLQQFEQAQQAYTKALELMPNLYELEKESSALAQYVRSSYHSTGSGDPVSDKVVDVALSLYCYSIGMHHWREE